MRKYSKDIEIYNLKIFPTIAHTPEVISLPSQSLAFKPFHGIIPHRHTHTDTHTHTHVHTHTLLFPYNGMESYYTYDIENWLFHLITYHFCLF